MSFEEDVKDVLRGVLRQNGLQSMFRPGVEGKITFEFKDMPLQAAFNKLLVESGLGYDYDPQTRLVTVFPAGTDKRVQVFVPLAEISGARVLAAVRQFGLRGNISVDDVNKTAFIEGTPDEAKAFQDLIERLDKAAGTRRAAASANQQATARAEQADAEREKAEAQARAEETKAEIQKKILDQMLRRDVRVIPLRFATVGETQRTFGGRSVTIPGIEQTLNALLGLGERKKLEQGLEKSQQEQLRALTFGAGLAPAPGARPGGAAGQASEEAALLMAGSFSTVTIAVDQRTNSVVARGTPEELDRVEKIVRGLDKPVPMVEIEVMIVKVNNDFARTLGIGITGEKNLLSTSPTAERTGRIIGAGSGNANVGGADPSAIIQGLGAAATSVSPVLSAANNLVGGYLWRSTLVTLQAQIRAAESDNSAQTIGAPTIVTLNNVAARIQRTATEFFTTASGAGVGGTGTAVNVLTSIDVGLKLDILPSVIPRENPADEELVRLAINSRNTSLSGSPATNIATSGQEIQTDVVIPNGRTFIMGGLTDDTRTENRDGIPFLKDIPYLGQLFRTDSKTDNLDQTVFFITPKIIHSEQVMARDIAERRYLQNRQQGLTELKSGIYEKSRLLKPLTTKADEDE